jgi:hypothetical protein
MPTPTVTPTGPMPPPNGFRTSAMFGLNFRLPAALAVATIPLVAAALALAMPLVVAGKLRL